MENQTQKLLGDIELFLTDQDMPATVFGIKSAGDPKLVFDLRAGRELRFATAQKIDNFMRAAV